MFKSLVLVVACLFASLTASAQSVPYRVGSVVQTHATVGTTTADAISAASVSSVLISFKICNDAENTSTHLLVGTTADAATNGVMLGKGQCYECENCKPSILKAMKVKAQAASNGYSVIQYKQ
jgi:hypothetical protein